MISLTVDKPFVDVPPSPVNAVEIFSGEWASSFPAGFPPTTALGSTPLFEDPRIHWANEVLRKFGRGIEGASVLELGPLEGGHTYMMSKLGAKEIVALEANTRAYLKCLVAKEVLGITRANFLLGDALPYLRNPPRRFDLGVACAFLNHLVEPVEVIERLAACCDAVFIWNVVHGPALFQKQPALESRFAPRQENTWAGFRHYLHPHFYGEGVDYRRFWGGMKPSCCWMETSDVLSALRHFGFTRLEHMEEENPFGHAVRVVAVKG